MPSHAEGCSVLALEMPAQADEGERWQRFAFCRPMDLDPPLFANGFGSPLQWMTPMISSLGEHVPAAVSM